MRTITLFTLAMTILPYASAKTVSVAKLPLSFEPNRGQAEAGTLFLARGNGYLIGLEPAGARLLIRRGGNSAAVVSSLVGAKGGASLEALDPLPGRSNYFRGPNSSKWVTGIPTFARVRASQVYPGIDLVYYGNQSRLEYDFVVAPGADPGVIRMRFDGAASPRVDGNGDLALATAAGEIRQQKPVVYQTIGGERKEVAGQYRIWADKTATFELGAYDRTKTLVIDPTLDYSSFLGGAAADEGHGVAADSTGHLYLTGVTFSTTNGDADVLVRKVSADGSFFVYNADLGGSGDDIGNGIAVDPSGSAYVGGRTSSADFPVASAFQSQILGNFSAFALRLDPTGSTLIFSTYLGGSSDDRGFAIAVDNQGSAYLAGAASSPDFPVSGGAFQSQLAGGLDCFVAKFDSQGNAIFSTLIGGGGDDQAFGIAVDDFGISYITGQTNSDSYPQANPSFQHSRHGGLDAFLTEITADGSGLIFSTFVGGGGDDSGAAVAVDQAGDAFITGTTSSGDFPTTNGAFQIGYAGGSSDAFVTAYTTNGQFLMFSTLLGSHGTDEGNGIAVDSVGNVYMAGDTNSDQYPITGDAIQLNRAGGYDAVVSILDPTGSQLQYGTFLGGSSDDKAYALALDANGTIYLTGITSSGDFPVTGGAAQVQAGGGDSDAFYAQIGFPSFRSFLSTAKRPEARSAFRRGLTAPAVAGKFATPTAGRRPAGASPSEERFGRPQWRMQPATSH